MSRLFHGRVFISAAFVLLVLMSYTAAQESAQNGNIGSGQSSSDEAEARRQANEQVAKIIAER